MKVRTLILLFLLSGNVFADDKEKQPLIDNRIAIELSQPQKNFALERMRRMLETLTVIQTSLLNQEPEKIADAVHTLMQFTAENHPDGMREAIPPAFRQISQGMNQQWRMLLDKEKSPKEIQGTVTNIMASCNGCHRAYRIK